MKKENLIIGRYYYIKHNNDNICYYFKFGGYDKDFILSQYYFYIECYQEKYHYKITHNNNFADIYWFENQNVCLEVDLKDMVDILPNNNLDKINYMRIQKIQKLLKC